MSHDPMIMEYVDRAYDLNEESSRRAYSTPPDTAPQPVVEMERMELKTWLPRIITLVLIVIAFELGILIARGRRRLFPIRAFRR
ncbi:MAG: hypothetical protein U0694_26275 [Anaerolineae bacterium]